MEQYENQSNSNLDLAQFDDAFETAEVEEREFEAVPDGKYQVNVDRVELTRAQTSGNPMLKWTLRILAPTHKGRLLWRNNVMASNENIKWLKQDLYHLRAAASTSSPICPANSNSFSTSSWR